MTDRAKPILRLAPVPESVEEDASLVDRIQAGDRDAFEIAFHLYAPALHTFARGYLGSSEDAADLVQDIFVRLWRQGAGRRCRPTVRVYLYTAVRNGALNRLRNGRRRSILTKTYECDVVEETLVGLSSDEKSDSFAARVEAVYRAIGRLPAKHRTAFLLRWQHGCSYAEIAAILEIPVRTVESRIGKALRLLREWCHSEGTPQP